MWKGIVHGLWTTTAAPYFRLVRVQTTRGTNDAKRFSYNAIQPLWPANHLYPQHVQATTYHIRHPAETTATLTPMERTGGGAQSITVSEIEFAIRHGDHGVRGNTRNYGLFSGSGSRSVDPHPYWGYRVFRLRTRGSLGEA
jgi:hypothetical protein